MKPELITNSRQIEARTGIPVEAVTLQSTIFLEGPGDRLPLLVRGDDGQMTLLLRRIELGNYLPMGVAEDAALRSGVRLAVYDPYFTMSDIGEEYPVYADEGEAIRAVCGCDAAVAHVDMPYARYRRIAKKLALELTAYDLPWETLYVYEVDRDYVIRRFTEVDPAAISAAKQILKERTHISAADEEYLARLMAAEKDNPFALLDQMLAQAGVRCVLLDTKLSVHTATAMPWDDIQPGRMFARYEQGRIQFFSAVPQVRSFLKPMGEIAGVQALLAEFDGEPALGIEEKSLPVGIVQTLGAERCKGVSAVLTLWRDRCAWQFLPYYIINGAGNTYALEAGVEYGRHAVETGETVMEQDVDRQYVRALQEFIRMYGLEGYELRKYFSGIQVGGRCPFAALPSRYPLRAGLKTLKLDCGAQLFRDGILLSGSDQCRSWCPDPGAARVQEIIGQVARETVIPAVRSGMEGREAYRIGMRTLAQYTQELWQIGMLPPGFDLIQDYRRNIGHTFSKAESVSVTLDARTAARFETNMICCVEFHWPYQDRSFGVEDMFLVTPDHSINFTY